MTFRAGTNRIFRSVLIALCMALCFCAATPALAADGQTEQRTVRVAFPSQGGMGNVGQGGDLVGYNYSYLQEIAEYAGWDITYITFEDQSVDDGIMSAMQMVMSGEADLLGPMLRSTEAEQMFAFPDNNYGVVYTTLCALEKSNLTAVNYIACSPLRVAVYAGAAVRNQEVTNYLEQIGVDYELIYCDSTGEQKTLLEESKADVLSSITLSYFDDTRAVAEFAPRPYYFVSTPGNTELLEELDAAIATMNYTRPHFQEQLQDEFFGDTSGGYVLTDSEQSCIAALGTLHVLCASDYAPYSSRSSTGEPTGLLVSLLTDFTEQNGLDIAYTFCESTQEMERAWATGEYDCVIGLPLTSEYCSKHSLLRTTPVVSVSMGLFRSQQTAKPYEESTVAIYGPLADSVNLSSFANVQTCDTLEDCFTAVESNQADYGCVNRLSMDYQLYEQGSNYITTPLLGEQLDICVAVSRSLDIRILSALNKYIYALSDSTKTTYLSNASQHESLRSFSALVRSNPIGSAIFIASVVILFVSLLLFAFNARKNKQRNIELEKANAAMQQANAAKSEFLSCMSHDIRTPMNAIIGFAELGKQDVASPELIQEDLERISSSGEFLLGLVNDILDMTKIESHAMELKPQAYPREEFEKQIETLVAPLCTAKQLHFTVQMDDTLPDCIYVDKLRFNQIFFNLLSNAVKFTPTNGTVAFIGTALEKQDSAVRIRFTVRDNGIGMSEEFQKRMFESFSQEQQHISGQEGTGLGLSIVKSFVELMHGTIRVESRLSEGSTFIVELPLEACPLPEKESVREYTPKSALAGKHVLLCEDHPINTKLACRLLEKAGVQVTCTVNGAEGVQQFQNAAIGYFDAVLMDIRMPVMDGIQATREIRALHRPDAKTVPIIAVTANAFDDDVQACMAAGMNAHLSKPFEIDKLYEVLARKW